MMTVTVLSALSVAFLLLFFFRIPLLFVLQDVNVWTSVCRCVFICMHVCVVLSCVFVLFCCITKTHSQPFTLPCVVLSTFFVGFLPMSLYFLVFVVAFWRLCIRRTPILETIFCFIFVVVVYENSCFFSSF